MEMAPEKSIAALLLIASLLAFVVAQDSTETIIGTGSIISTADTGNANWFSSSGRFAFGFYQEGSGFAVGIQFFPNPNSSNSIVIWRADRDGQPIHGNANLTFGSEGLVLHVDEGDRAISNPYDDTSSFAFASMLDSGNFVFYDGNRYIAWQTFDNPTDTLMAGQTLSIGKDLISSVSEKNHSSGRFRFAMQKDGYAVLYPVNTPETETHANWALESDSYYGLALDQNGNLTTAGSSQSSSQDTGYVHFLRIEPDGYLRIYSTNQTGFMTLSAQYPSGDNKCSIKGACGLNSFCNSTGKGEVFCFCFPGYVYINASRKFEGCQRNFTRGSCDAVSSSTSNSAPYNMSKLPNISLSDDPYNSSQVKSEDECSNACLRDCDCYAALFFPSTKQCSKQRHPFQYGRALFGQDKAPTAFFKIVSEEQKHQPSVKPVSIGSLRMLGTLPLVVSLLVTAIFAVAFDFLIFFLCRYRIEMYRRLCESMETGLAKAMAPRLFTYKQLEDATDGYKDKIGEGTYGIVFKGSLTPRDEGTPIALPSLANNLENIVCTIEESKDLGTVTVDKLPSSLEAHEQQKKKEEEALEEALQSKIAVKKLKSVPGKMEEEFRNELKSIGRLHHRNLVRLLGFCHEGSEWILVYEYMSRGSLADLIFKPDEIALSWKRRTSIAMDVAAGLCHLHEGCDVAIIHGDIKPENVLIGNNYRAKIGDLGLAKHLQPGKHLTYTRSRGTSFYKAPEWKNSNYCVSTKVDVVSFGILLLELILLKKYFQPKRIEDEYFLSTWAYKCLKGQYEWKLPGKDVDTKELEEMVKVALWCLHGSPEERPSMFDVVMMLSRKKVVQFPPVPLEDWGVRAAAGEAPLAGAERV